jgi:hypothetical protein
MIIKERPLAGGSDQAITGPPLEVTAAISGEFYMVSLSESPKTLPCPHPSAISQDPVEVRINALRSLANSLIPASCLGW